MAIEPAHNQRIPAVIAHRGLHGDGVAVENSIASLHRAVDSGVDAVEFDVRRLSDGRHVVHHDARLGGAPLAHLTLDEVRGAARHVATLEEFAEDGARRGANLVMELKDPRGTREALDIVLDRVPADRLTVMSFEPEAVRATRLARPSVPAGLLLYKLPLSARISSLVDPGGPVRAARRVDASFLALHRDLATERVISRAARAGLPVRVWTVDDPAQLAHHLADPRVEGVITDVPELALRTRARIYGDDAVRRGVGLLRAVGPG